MPTILREFGFRFFFYSNEGNEPPHIHVEKGGASGKYWLDPVEKSYAYDFTKSEEKKIESIVIQKKEFFKKKRHEYFGS